MAPKVLYWPRDSDGACRFGGLRPGLAFCTPATGAPSRQEILAGPPICQVIDQIDKPAKLECVQCCDLLAAGVACSIGNARENAMSLHLKIEKAMEKKHVDAYLKLLHDDYKFVSHQSGKNHEQGYDRRQATKDDGQRQYVGAQRSLHL